MTRQWMMVLAMSLSCPAFAVDTSSTADTATSPTANTADTAGTTTSTTADTADTAVTADTADTAVMTDTAEHFPGLLTKKNSTQSRFFLWLVLSFADKNERSVSE